MEKLSPLGPVYQAGTLSGNPVAMTAGLTTLQKLERDNVHAKLEERTARFVSRLESDLRASGVQIVRVGSIFWMVFQSSRPRASNEIEVDGIARFNRMYERFLRKGVYLPPSGYEVCFVSAAHSEAILSEAADHMVAVISDDR
jgi:glutamate-1-semialdehyde 2,1-aminomutase